MTPPGGHLKGREALIYPQVTVLLKPAPSSCWLLADPQPCPFPPTLPPALLTQTCWDLLCAAFPGAVMGREGELCFLATARLFVP